ncbi:MAG: hypothetical protein R3Y56_08545 [Akkermansia sp.]
MALRSSVTTSAPLGFAQTQWGFTPHPTKGSATLWTLFTMLRIVGAYFLGSRKLYPQTVTVHG